MDHYGGLRLDGIFRLLESSPQDPFTNTDLEHCQMDFACDCPYRDYGVATFDVRDKSLEGRTLGNIPTGSEPSGNALCPTISLIQL